MNVDDELRRLFSDDRLELRPLPDAEHAVLTGVKRRQRRRRAAIAATGAFSALAVATGTLVALQPQTSNTVQPADTTALTFTSTPAPTSAEASSTPQSEGQQSTTATPSRSTTGGGGNSGGPPPASSSSKTSTSSSAPRTFGTVTMGPTSYRGLSLGMTQEQAVATGLIKPNAKPESNNGSCLGYDYAGSPRQAGYYSVVISKTKGVVRINGRGDERTVDGIGVGASAADFDKVYPKFTTPHGAVGERVVDVAGNAAANYWFIVQNDAVKEIRLELKAQDCYQ